MAGYFRGGNISQMPSDAIIHKEIFHKCMALNTMLNLANFHKENFYKLSSICKISPSSTLKITVP